MIDSELVTRKLGLIVDDLKSLRRFADMDLNTFLGDEINEVAVERYLERLIGRMIDINYHLLTELGHAPPRDYYSSFVELGPIRVLPADFARSLASAAGLRNRIAHEYDTLDPSRVHEALRGALLDVPRYIELVDRFVGQDVANRTE